MTTAGARGSQRAGRRRRRPHRDLKCRSRDELADLPRLSGPRARGRLQLRRGRLSDLARRAPDTAQLRAFCERERAQRELTRNTSQRSAGCRTPATRWTCCERR